MIVYVRDASDVDDEGTSTMEYTTFVPCCCQHWCSSVYSERTAIH